MIAAWCAACPPGSPVYTERGAECPRCRLLLCEACLEAHECPKVQP